MKDQPLPPWASKLTLKMCSLHPGSQLFKRQGGHLGISFLKVLQLFSDGATFLPWILKICVRDSHWI